MESISCHRQIISRIMDMKDGSVMAITDFTDLGEPKTISKALGRICESGLIEKLLRGVFWKRSDYAPDVHEIAAAIARANNWKMLPSGDSALNLFGLGNPGKIKLWTYITDGTYRKYSCKGYSIAFKHVTSKMMKSISEETSLVVQIIKACGPEISQEQKEKIRSYFSPQQVSKILSEAKHLSSWIASLVTGIFKTEKN